MIDDEIADQPGLVMLGQVSLFDCYIVFIFPYVIFICFLF